MRGGTLKKRITIEQLEGSLDSYGEEAMTWVTFASVRASVRPVSGREYFAARQEQSEVTHKVRFRYVSGVTPDMRINYGGRYFDIAFINDIFERHREIEIMATEQAT